MTPSSHSTVDSFVRPLLGRDDPGKRVVMALICYLDDSGGDGDVPAITIGGYIAGLRAWQEIEPAARALFDSEGVDYLHGKRFHHSKGPFKGWGQGKKIAFVQKLYAILRPLAVAGVGFSAIKSELKRRNAETGLNKHTSTYGFAFLGLANLLLQDKGLRSWIESMDGMDLSFVVEAGHKNDGDLIRIFNEVKASLQERDGLGHKFKSMSFVDKKSCTAVQMADFLVYHITRQVTAIEKNNRKPVPRTPVMAEIFNSEIRHITATATHFWEDEAP